MLRRDLLKGAGGAAALFLPGLAGCQRKAQPQQVNIVSTAGTTNLVIAELIRRMGYYEDLGVTANYATVGDGAKVVAALISGEMDICPMSGFTQVLAAIERGASLKIVGGAAIKNFSALMSGNPAVRTLKDLEGRTVGVGALGTQLHQSMVALFRKYGVDADKVTFANVGASVDVFKAVKARVVDAGAAEIWLQPGSGLHFVEQGKLYESLPEFINQASFVTDRAIAQKRDLIVRTLAAHARVYRFIMSGDSEADFVAASGAALGKTDAAAQDSARGQWRFYRQIQPFAADLILTEDRMRFMQDLNIATGTQKALLPYDKATDMSLARDALALI
jgi:ABC-type nitrate/sulfonate/bicarbonate transport system substrate-binding protein